MQTCFCTYYVDAIYICCLGPVEYIVPEQLLAGINVQVLQPVQDIDPDDAEIDERLRKELLSWAG